MDRIQLNGNNIAIELLCRYDSTTTTHKTIIEISNHPMHYVWYNMPQHSTIRELLNKIRKIYALNIKHIDEFDTSTPILDIKIIQSIGWRYIDALTVNLNGNHHNNSYLITLSSILTKNADNNILKRNVSQFLDNIYCPLQCEVKYSDINRNIYNDIPNKQQLIDFLSNIPQREIVSNQLTINISLPLITLKINHQNQIFYFYGFKNILFLYDQFHEYGSKIINNKYKINYNNILELLNIDGYTFMDPLNQHLELDLYQELSARANGNTLYTKSISITKHNRCVICQQDNVSQSEFTRIDCCEHRYHYQCIKQYIQHNDQHNAPQCPLCRKPFTLIQVHNNLILQTLDINNCEFKSHEMQYSDITMFSDEFIAVSNDAQPPALLSPPFVDELDELDEFYRVGLSIINSGNNSTETVHIDDENVDNDGYNALNMDEDEDGLIVEQKDVEYDRSRDNPSKSSYSDKIGRLSLSNLSTSDRTSNFTRPSLRYSPIPFSVQSDSAQNSPTPSQLKHMSLSSPSGSASSNSLNLIMNNLTVNNNDGLRLYPIDSLHSMASHLNNSLLFNRY